MEIIIKREVLQSALAGASAAYPNEFICLLIGERKKDTILIEETVIPPGIGVSETFSYYSEWMQPIMPGLIGTFHSHPNGNARPSAADLRLFSQKGGINLIAGYPYGESSVVAYLGSGKRVNFGVLG